MSIQVRVHIAARNTQRIRRQIPAEIWIIIPVVVIMEPRFLIEILSGEPEVIDDTGGPICLRPAEWLVNTIPYHLQLRIHYHDGNAEVVIDIKIHFSTGDIDHRKAMEPTGLGSIQVLLGESTVEITFTSDIPITADIVVKHRAGTIDCLDHPLAEPTVNTLA